MHAFRQIDDSLFQAPPGYGGHSEGFQPPAQNGNRRLSTRADIRARLGG